MDAAHFIQLSTAPGQPLAATAAMSKAAVKHTLDTGLTVAGLVLVGIGSLIAKRKQQQK